MTAYTTAARVVQARGIARALLPVIEAALENYPQYDTAELLQLLEPALTAQLVNELALASP
jgi:hypothetical protein